MMFDYQRNEARDFVTNVFLSENVSLDFLNILISQPPMNQSSIKYLSPIMSVSGPIN